MTDFNDTSCYTDFRGLQWSPRKYLAKLLKTNTELASKKYYGSGDDIAIQINGPDIFRERVQTILEQRLFPYVHLKFRFVEDGGNILIDNKWNHGGVTISGGAQYPTIHLGNTTPYLVLHMAMHALGMSHEYRDPPAQLAWIVPHLEECFRHRATDELVAKIDNYPSLPANVHSVIVTPPDPIDELSDYDKAWLDKAYGS